MRIRIPILLIPLLLAAGPSAARDAGKLTTEERFRKNLAEGAAFLEKGTRQAQARALGRFSKALKIRPDSAEAHFWIALTYSDYSNYRLAADYASKAVLCDEGMAKAWLLWGQCLLYLREFDKAREKLEQAHRLDNRNPLIVFNLARCHYHGWNNIEIAKKLFTRVIDLERQLGADSLRSLANRARLYIGCCYMAKDMAGAAIIRFKDVLRLEPDNLEARYRLGLAYRKSLRFDEAEKELRTVVSRQPEQYEAHLQLGHLYLSDIPDPEMARVHLARFLKYAPEDHEWRERVIAFLAKKPKDGALPPPPKLSD